MEHKDLELKKTGEIRVRIAPSPTGALHVGTARTALFNYLFAKKNQGIFILRIEDTDKERSEKKWEEDITENLKWLGLEYTEGPDTGGERGPYRQSKRGDIYLPYLKKLLQENKAYYCFCSEEELEAHRQYLISIGRPPIYSGKCANLTKKEIKENFKEKKSAIVRFKIPGQKIKFKDKIRDEVEFDGELIGDISLAKNIVAPLSSTKKKDNKEISFLYNFAAVIDDYEMKISHVIRGEDHLSNTPKQISIQRALNLPQPEYAHLPLILGSDRSKLSKRHGAVSIAEYRKKGYLPEAIINFMAFLGWNPGDEREIFSLNSLVKEFSFNRVGRSGAVFNIKKLDSLNGFYLRQKSKEKITELCLPYLIEANFIEPEKEKDVLVEKITPKTYKIKETKEEISIQDLQKIVSLYQERLKKLSEIKDLTDFFFKKKLDYKKELLQWKDMTDKEIKISLDKSYKVLSEIKKEDWTKNNLQDILMKEAEKLSLKRDSKEIKGRGYLLWPLRAALTGKRASAGPFELAEVLGKQRSQERIKQAKEKLK